MHVLALEQKNNRQCRFDRTVVGQDKKLIRRFTYEYSLVQGYDHQISQVLAKIKRHLFASIFK